MPGFEDILGQSHIKKELCRAAKGEKVSHAYIIAGEALSGKKFIAKAFAQTLLCEKPRISEDGIEPCEECPSCKKVVSLSHPDLRVIAHEKPSNISVSEIKEQLSDDCVLMPYSGKRKIYIVPDAELMNVSTQNKLLKTLEEPPSYVTIMLLASSAEALLPTIRSRCVLFRMQAVENGILKDYLVKEKSCSEVNALFAARYARGSAGRAITLAEDTLFAEKMRRMLALITDLHVMDIARINRELKELFGSSCEDVKARDDFFHLMQCVLRDMLVFRATEDKNSLIFSDKAEYISNVALNTSFYNIEKVNDGVRVAAERIKRNVDALYVMEAFLADARELLNVS